ncbi:unnamed protein product [Caenorhabditis auriculariae]|uniref:Galectin n=1 Tax=Caenorhabditis auriculariae TaxID=2777116 RepID=A0A8S1GYX1_9PELO|nr:unnamed protein product [Caenorhabditis auriculariae]
MATIQRFPLPTLPFGRNLDHGLPVGSKVEISAKAYPDQIKTAVLRLKTQQNDEALRLVLPFQPDAKMRMDCVIGGTTSSAVENPVRIAIGAPFKLQLLCRPHSFEILLDGTHIADFVHRTNPEDIKEISIGGPLICENVVVEAASGPPTYYQAIGGSSASAPELPQKPKEVPTKPSGPADEDFPPPPTSIGNRPAAGSTTTSTLYTGSSQGFSNHPYPLPGLVDQSTYSSQQHQPGSLPPRPTVQPPAPPPAQTRVQPTQPTQSSFAPPPPDPSRTTIVPYPTSDSASYPKPQPPPQSSISLSTPGRNDYSNYPPPTSTAYPQHPGGYGPPQIPAQIPQPQFQQQLPQTYLPYNPQVQMPIVQPTLVAAQPAAAYPYAYQPAYYYPPNVYEYYPGYHYRHHHHHHCD